MKASVTERSFYPPLIKFIGERSGTGVSEVKYSSEQDIVFDFLDRKGLLSLKIGESIPILKNAFIQYQRHKKESKLTHGIILFLRESVRSTAVGSEIPP